MNQGIQVQLLLLSERPRLVRLCARLSGNREAAEDLAQETLLQAWKHWQRLQSWDQASAWLSGIARNVCLHWSRRHYREEGHRHPSSSNHTPTSVPPEISNDFDLELELERAELGTLLDRALALLPNETRTALVCKYIQELPYAEIAQYLGMDENSVAVRVHRGKLTLRRVLANELRSDVTAYGFIKETTDRWQETQIWCPRCGRQRLLARIPNPPGIVSFRCPRCAADPDETISNFNLANHEFLQRIGTLKRPKSILRKMSLWAHEYFLGILQHKLARCTNCGSPAEIRSSKNKSSFAVLQDPHFLYVSCKSCGEAVSQSFGGLILALPQAQRFWHEEKQIQILPSRQIESDGQMAIVTRLQSLRNTARLEIVAAPDPFRLIYIESHTPEVRTA